MTPKLLELYGSQEVYDACGREYAEVEARVRKVISERLELVPNSTPEVGHSLIVAVKLDEIETSRRLITKSFIVLGCGFPPSDWEVLEDEESPPRFFIVDSTEQILAYLPIQGLLKKLRSLCVPPEGNIDKALMHWSEVERLLLDIDAHIRVMLRNDKMN